MCAPRDPHKQIREGIPQRTTVIACREERVERAVARGFLPQFVVRRSGDDCVCGSLGARPRGKPRYSVTFLLAIPLSVCTDGSTFERLIQRVGRQFLLIGSTTLPLSGVVVFEDDHEKDQEGDHNVSERT